MARVVWSASVVRSRGVMGSRGMIISTDEAAKVISTNQFFNFILECFAVFCSVAIVAVVAAIFGHITLGGVVVWHGGGMRSACKASSRRRDIGTLRGAYLVKRGWWGSRGRVSGWGDGGVGLAVVAA